MEVDKQEMPEPEVEEASASVEAQPSIKFLEKLVVDMEKLDANMEKLTSDIGKIKVN